MKNTSGFTLVELLVVVTIIAILSVVGIAIFTNTQVSARNAKRSGDLEAISKTLEANYGKDVTGGYKLDPTNQFNSKVNPTEQSTSRPAYCLWYTTARSAAAIKTKPAYSSTTWTLSACPTADTVTGTPLASATTAPTGTSTAMYSWMVCAVLENPDTVICKFNAQ